MNCKYKIKNSKWEIAGGPVRRSVSEGGYALPLVLFAMLILVILCFGETMTSYSTRIQAVSAKAETEAMLVAEAGYEKAIFWMSQQGDILGALQAGGGHGTINFDSSACSYDIGFNTFIGARPVFGVTSIGTSGRPTFTRIVDVNVMQETAGWAMGACRVPYTATTTGAVNFATGEIVDMPLHINNFNDSPDERDIQIATGGTPRFLRRVEMGESRKTSGGSDKYSGVITLFEGGIHFDQPNIRITDEDAVQSKINRFRDSITDSRFKLEPNGTANISTTYSPATTKAEVIRLNGVQLEFFTVGEAGKVRITNNCTVLGYRRKGDSTPDNKTWDFNTVPGTGGSEFQRYYIYAYHYAPDPNIYAVDVNIGDTYVSQTFGGYTSEPGGQIYVNGNVIIGGNSTTSPDQVVKGKITVVATGNIWVADSIKVDDNGGTQRDADGKPLADTDNPNFNPNVLGLIAKGIVKVVDPGMSKQTYNTSPNYYPNGPNWATTVADTRGAYPTYPKHYYRPIGNGSTVDTNDRTLPDPTVVEAAITVGGGGWGAENVTRRANAGAGTLNYGGRKEYSGTKDELVVRGSLTEVVRGVVGYPSPYEDGYGKNYYIDNRLMSGILPGDIWFTGKYIPAPAGWHDYSINN